MLIAIIVFGYLVFGGDKNDKGEEIIPAATLNGALPGIPLNLNVKARSAEEVELSWKGPGNELSFQIIRDGRLIKEVSKDVNIYIDNGLRPATTYEYEVFAVNNIGKSGSGIIISRTKNPSVLVRLDKIGVADNGEDALRQFVDKNGEIFLGIVVSDGKESVTIRLPQNGYYDLSDDSDVDVGLALLSTQEIGDYLKINVIGFESDGGKGEEILIQALDMAVTYYTSGLTSIILDLAGIDLKSTFQDIVGFDDDFLGEYIEEWNKSNNWGIGPSRYIECEKGDGIGLRFWFTISSPFMP